MNSENLQMLRLAVEHLDDLLDEVVFVGGATIELWITDPAAPEFRPTVDVDVVAEAGTLNDYYRFEERIRGRGFENHTQDGVICRFKHGKSGLVLDVMPTAAEILGFDNRWQRDAFGQARWIHLPSGERIKAIPPPFLLATKLEAFATRGKLDFYGSRDFGDTITLIDGRAELIEETQVAATDLQLYVSRELSRISRHRNFESGVEGALAAGPEARDRADLVVIPRVNELIASG